MGKNAKEIQNKFRTKFGVDTSPSMDLNFHKLHKKPNGKKETENHAKTRISPPQINLGPLGFPCENCEVVSISKGDLKIHQSKIHNSIFDDAVPHLKAEKQIKPRSGRSYGDQKAMGPLGFPCEHCEIVLITEGELNIHNSIAHDENKKIVKTESKNLEENVETSVGSLPINHNSLRQLFKCECKMEFITRWGMDVHKSLVHNKKNQFIKNEPETDSKCNEDENANKIDQFSG